MADNEKLRKPHPPRRNAPTRPTPGVQKARQNFGVDDLRHYLNKKHQEQGESQNDKQPDPKKLPPPDPSYNYLKDPSRDHPKQPPSKKEHIKKPQERQYVNKNRLRNEQLENTGDVRHREQESNNNLPLKKLLKEGETNFQNKEDGTIKKELRFSDTSKDIESEPQFSRGGRSSFKGRNQRRGHGGKPREDRDVKIENPFNIKIQLSTETGQRSCTIDESTKIADIKHIPDQISSHRSPRGSFRGGRGGFRGRGRSRGSFRGRNYNRGGRPSNSQKDYENPENPNSNEGANVEQACTQEDEEASQEASNTTTEESTEAHLEQQYEDYEQDNESEEFADSNENYEGEYSSEDFGKSPGLIQNVDETSPEAERYDQNATTSFDSHLTKTITITSSKYQDGEMKRSVEVKATSNGSKENDSAKKPGIEAEDNESTEENEDTKK